MKQKHFIDLNKGLTCLAILASIAVYNRWGNTTAWVYLALHGSYGLLWVMKSRIFPDRQWEQRTGWAYGLVIFFGLCLYWTAGWLVVAFDVQAPPWLLALCISVNTFGIFLHFTADMQKFVALNMKPEHLVRDGLFARVRNINYFGELLIYAGFGALAKHWLPWLILAAWVLIIWLPNMRRKERSLARYPDFSVYRQQSKLFIPFLF